MLIASKIIAGAATLARCRATGFVACLLAAAVVPARAAVFSQIDIGQEDTVAILLHGQIVAGDFTRFQAALRAAPKGKRTVLMLSSGGGSIVEGLAIGRAVYAAKITTVALGGSGNFCASACTQIFLAGRDFHTGKPTRIMMQGAKLGFHQTSLGTPDPKKAYSAAEVESRQTGVQNAVALIQTYFRELQIDAEFMSLTLSAPASGLTYLSELDALRLGIYVVDPRGRLLTPESFEKLKQ